MARLIDADDLIERIEDVLSRREHRQAEVPSWLQKIIDELPTAYDVEKVVGELDKIPCVVDQWNKVYLDKNDVIAKVRKGGVE